MTRLLLGVLVIPLGLDLYLPFPEENPPTPTRIEVGRRLFSDTRLSRDGTIACATCHQRERGFADGRPVSTGVFGRSGRRNAPALINRGYGRLFFWDGRVRTLEEQVLEPIADPNEMDLPVADAAMRVGLTPEELAFALATYVRVILSGNAPYDRFIAGDRSALTADAQEGLRVFRGKANCVACHVGPTFTDERLHNTGVAWRDGVLADPGAGEGRFKTPTLREVARSGPYMHDGTMASLEEVVAYYDRGGNANPGLDSDVRPLRLTREEARALVVFLQSLSGTITEGL